MKQKTWKKTVLPLPYIVTKPSYLELSRIVCCYDLSNVIIGYARLMNLIKFVGIPCCWITKPRLLTHSQPSLFSAWISGIVWKRGQWAWFIIWFIYLITWNFRDTLISRFWGSHISRHLSFAILRKFCILTHFYFAFLRETHCFFVNFTQHVPEFYQT